MKHRLTAFLAAFLLTAVQSAALPVNAETAPQPAAVEEAVYEQLMEYQFLYDTNNDDIITDAELYAADQIYLELDNVTDLSWVKNMTEMNYVSFKGGTMTDFTFLKDLPKLRNVSFIAVPIADISFLGEMDLETCRMEDMDEITLEQRLSILKWGDYTIEKGYSANVGVTPVGLLDGYSLEMFLADDVAAEFTNRQYGAYGEMQEVYGKNVGTTTYEMYADGEPLLSGTITVTERTDYDPPLRDAVTEPQILESYHYGSSNVVLENGTLYGIIGDRYYAAQENVMGYDSIYMKDAKGIYQYADLVLLTDGRLLVNGEEITDMTFASIENGCVITEDNALYAVYPSSSGFATVKLTDSFKEFPYASEYYYTAQSGEVMYYKVSYDSHGDPISTSSKTGIKNPISAWNHFFVDENNVLWQCKTYPSLSVTKMAEDVVEVGFYQMADGGSAYAFITSEGKAYSVFNTGKELTLAEDVGNLQSYLEAGGFYIHEYMEILGSENDCVIRYYITEENTLTLALVDHHFAMTNVSAAICAEYVAETGHCYIYFMRTDGSIWRYCFETEEIKQMSTAQVDVVAGDVNGDNKLTVADAVALQRWLHNDGTKLAQWKPADYDKNGVLNGFDLAFMKRALLA